MKPSTVRRLLVRFGPLVIALGVIAAVSRGYGAVLLTSGSMEPTLITGDLAVYRRGAPPRVRDIVLYRKEGWPGGVVHRVVRRLPDDTFSTRGDANPVGDRDPVRRESVRGRVVLVVPTGRALRAVVALARLG